MATVTVVEDQESKSPEPQKSDTVEERRLDMETGATIGAALESNRQMQERLNQYESERAAERAEREADRAEIRSAHARIAELTAALEEEEEDLGEVEKVIPPKVEEPPKKDEKPKPRRTVWNKILCGH